MVGTLVIGDEVPLVLSKDPVQGITKLHERMKENDEQ